MGISDHVYVSAYNTPPRHVRQGDQHRGATAHTNGRTEAELEKVVHAVDAVVATKHVH